MILVATNRCDLTSDYIVLELRRRGAAHVRLNTEDMPQASVAFRPERGWTLGIGGRTLALADFGAGYFRRPATPTPPASVRGRAERAYSAGEWSAVLRSLYAALGPRWLNAPDAIARAEDKPMQLGLARSLGLSVPDTLVTNEPAAATAFAAAGPTVAKPLREALIEVDGGERVIFTARVGGSLAHAPPEAVTAAPIVLQREIPKALDVRATVVGDRVFAAEIHSQALAETEVDWRRGARPDLRHEAHELPNNIASACVRMTRSLGLRFGAVDLVLDRDGHYWFLEINPNGQWAWIENRTGLPISGAIADELQAIAQA